jgi:hypothetical protein
VNSDALSPDLAIEKERGADSRAGCDSALVAPALIEIVDAMTE